MTPIPRFIALSTKDDLDPSLAKLWCRTVREFAPSGVATTVPVPGPDGAYTSVAMICRSENGVRHYIVPLTRDLVEKEAARIVDSFVVRSGGVDFSISTPTIEPPASTAAPLPVAENKYLALCAAFAKREHERWLAERTKSGWRYGTTMSMKNKTHPLLRPWDELPDRFRKLDPTLPQMVLDLLNEQGYAVITRAELDSLLALQRHS